jgi:hypothetical protein
LIRQHAASSTLFGNKREHLGAYFEISAVRGLEHTEHGPC